jgi:hypothetical protein
MLAACGSIEDQYWSTGVRREEWAEIRSAIRAITPSPVTSCSRSPDDRSGQVLVWTADHKSYEAQKINGSWHFKEVVIII